MKRRTESLRIDSRGVPALKTAVATSMVAALLCGAPASAGDGLSLSDESNDASDYWLVLADTSLRESLEAWSESAGWTVIWDSAADYRIRAPAMFSGSFENAVSELILAVHQSNPELSVTLYRGNKVVHAAGTVASR